MRFVSADQHLDCATLVEASSREAPATALARLAARLIHERGVVVFRIGRLRLGMDDSRALAHLLVGRLRDVLVEGGAPADLRVEVDRPQVTFVPDGFATRTLLPHHDGQHCSFLTPSRLDDPAWDPAMREFGSTGYTTTAAHKLYQGIFIADPGEALSVTPYYDWLAVIDDVRRSRGQVRELENGGGDAGPAARWLGDNLRQAHALQPGHGCQYPSLGAMLGVGDPMWHALSFHHAEAPVDPESLHRNPVAAGLLGDCPCGTCEGETGRLFCHLTLLATGRTWAAFRERWEVLAPSERGDLVIGHNLTTLHGGWAGGPGRLIEPVCLVLDRPEGSGYENWLAASWRRRLPSPGA